MRTRSRSLAIVTALAAGLVLGVAPPASADDAIEQGTKVCAAGEIETMVLRGRYGSLYTRGPGDSADAYRGYTTSSYRTYYDTGPGGYWKGRVSGENPDIDNDGTYAYCTY